MSSLGMRASAAIARVPDALPVVALAAAGLARLVPSAAIAARIDLLLAGLVLVTALDIDPRLLVAVSARWRLVLALSIVPVAALGLCAWGISQLAHGSTRIGVLALGLSPTEVAAVGLVGLIAGPAEIAIAVLACSLAVSALLGPPLLGLLSAGSHSVDVLPLLGRFLLVVIVPLIAGLVVRGASPELARRETTLASVSSLLVAALVYASLSDTRAGASNLAGAVVVSVAFLAVSTLLAAGSLRVLMDRSLALTLGMRDFAVASALASAAGGARAAHVAGVYGVLMLLAGAGVTGLVRWRSRR